MIFSKKKKIHTEWSYLKHPLYLVLISSVISCTPKATIDAQYVYNFGEMNSSDTLDHSFYIKNVSSEPLTILDVEGSCSCTALDFSSQPVQKGDSARIDVQFIPKEIGQVEKVMVFEANTTPPYTILKIKGIVKKE